MSIHAVEFIKMMKHPVKFRMFLFAKIPSAYFSGVRIKDLDEKKCEVTVPYKWFSQNPFRSTYFACLSMAAEMSTGVLAMTHIYKLDPPVSMLVVKTEAEYFKKATGKTNFICNDGEAMKGTIDKAIATGEGQLITALSTGYNKSGEIAAKFLITWSFKMKSKANKS
jgi:uncharacterized protein DUF4442